MSRESQLPPDFVEWIVRALDGTATPEQFAQLDHEIATSAAARTYYLEFITTYVGLMAIMGGLPKAETLVGAGPVPDSDESAERRRTSPGVVEYPAPQKAGNKDAEDLRVGPERPEPDVHRLREEERIREIERIANRRLAEFLAREQQAESAAPAPAEGWDLWSAICGAGQTARHVAAVGARMVKVAAVCVLVLAVFSSAGLYVYAHRTLGVLVDSTNAKWDVPLEQAGKLRAGPMTLEEGYARIKLNRGAEVILQAPSTFNLRSANRLFLDSGWITARVPPAALGFAVKTPASSIVDFGTEFGLLAGCAGNTEIHVFEGRIEFSRGGSADAGRTHQSLTKNEAMTVDAAGQTTRVPLDQRPHLFARAMPTVQGFGIPGKRLGLADMVGAGNGLDTGIWGQGIDVSTGGLTAGRRTLKGDAGGFRKVPSLPFVDGVFVPDSKDGPAVVTSTGIRFENGPMTSGKSYEAILNGASFQVGSAGEIHSGQLAGRTYDSRVHPSLGMHPNAGITFDLEAIRNAMPEARIGRFHARCGVSENVVRFAQRDADPNTIQVTFWVLVDGRPRFSRTLGVVPAQSELVDVPLDPSSHFLTLATTTPGEYRYCWALFAEPALDLTRDEEANTHERTR
jgi:hypothetical protein